MYGLLLKNLQEYCIKTFGAKKWQEVLEALKIKDVSLKFEIMCKNNLFEIFKFLG